MPEGHAGRGRQRKMTQADRRDVARPQASWGCRRRAAVATGRPATRQPRKSLCRRARCHLGTPALMGRGGEPPATGPPRGSAIGTGHFHGCGGSPGVLVGCVGAHRRWPVSICVLSKPNPNLPQSCSARGAPTGPLVGYGGRHAAGPIENPPGELRSKSRGHWSTVARWCHTRVGGSKNMAIVIASEPSCEFSLIIYSGGKSLKPTHPRAILRVVAKQRASAAITRRAPPPAARPSPWRSRSSSRWLCAVPACWLFAPCMYLGRRIRQPSQFPAGMPLRARVCDLAFAPLHSSQGPTPMAVGPCPPKSAD